MVLITCVFFVLQVMVIMAATGAIAAFLGTIALGNLLGASNMEGGLAMGAAGFMPIGGLIGAGLGAWLSYCSPRDIRF